ncbi:Ser/Thr protein kinase RdoA (MazF antagonist) [Catalinimonas alkaloidigena]|uniref:phosphotransferase enzyme family protein n=1 Tax=Catalinimonas alkaloidigena TaxID=1075417 RepID=UPI0024050E21|nr:aminoglycoside phosphotransferase family protein [Catalinimonas alkaloidigena]MDF9796943.1 Ser/Thr protein kinase RdoA (MazF antagonist) [Catalinimonas alkaloidigena]
MGIGDKFQVDEIISKFKVGDDDFDYKPFGSGHINDTFLVFDNQHGEADEATQRKYLLQRINHEVFRDVDGLMRNMNLVTTRLQSELGKSEEMDFTTVRIIPAHDDKLYYLDSWGNYWRMQTFIPNSTTYDRVTSEKQAFEAGYAFGKFQLLLENIDVNSLKETIPDFHNMEYRFKNFEAALQKDAVSRKASVEKEILFALARQEEMENLYEQVKNVKVPIRITHNDTKFNNVLLDKHTHKAICVIDLDTVMPGVIWYDFGDSIRTIVNTADEDEVDLAKIEVDINFFEAFTQGYLQETALLLTELEVNQLAFSSRYMTFIMGLRFLTDYLSGDVYYKTKHEHQNLQRARAQFKLVSQMERKSNEMEEIVLKTYHHFTDHSVSSE